jgi:FHS family L-fucose permease-like MFS transporter
MAIVGGAVLTPLMGVISDSSKSLALAYGIPLFAYIIIGGYSFTTADGRAKLVRRDSTG